MLDSVLAGLVVTVIIQGLKQLGIVLEGDKAKVVTLAVAALFLFANGMIDAFLPESVRPIAQQVVDFLKAILAIAVPAGLYGYAKLLASK